MPKQDVGLPPRHFLYTLDQIALLLDMNLPQLKKSYIYFVGNSVGRHSLATMLARNIADDADAPDWRVAEDELRRWLRRSGFRVYDRTALK